MTASVWRRQSCRRVLGGRTKKPPAGLPAPHRVERVDTVTEPREPRSVAIGFDTFAYRRRLPHLIKASKTLFVTFTTERRRKLSPDERTVALNCCVHDHLLTMFLHCAVVMPDHIHLLFGAFEDWTLGRILKRIKGNSSRLINALRQSRGAVWQHESFDHLLRSDEATSQKAEYICMNPVRAGFVVSPDDYPWIWREWIEGRRKE
jgi:putative transposase